MDATVNGLMGVSAHTSQEGGYLIYCPTEEDFGDSFMEEDLNEDFRWESGYGITKDHTPGMQMVAQSLFQDGNANSVQSVTAARTAATELPSETAPTGDQGHRALSEQKVVERALPNFALKAELEPQPAHGRRLVMEYRPGQVLDPHHKTGFEGQSVVKTEAIDSASSNHNQGGMPADAQEKMESDDQGPTEVEIPSGSVDVTGPLNTYKPASRPPIDQPSSHDIMRPLVNTPHTLYGQLGPGFEGHNVVKTESATVDPMQSHDNRRWRSEDAQGETECVDKGRTWTAIPSGNFDVTCRTPFHQPSSHDDERPLGNTPKSLHGPSGLDVEEHGVVKADIVDPTQSHYDWEGMPPETVQGTTERDHTSGLTKFNGHTETCSCGTCATPNPNYTRARISMEKPRRCPFCDKTFYYPSQLKRHIQTHTGEKSFTCPVCDRGFIQKSSLESHMVVHTGKKAFKCDICQKAFAQNSSLHSHKKIHTGERLHECGLCQKRFFNRKGLSRHMTTHTGERPYECTVCPKTFSQSYQLNTHMRRHRGERNFECSVCQMKFYSNSRLTSHMRSHTGERPFKCDECGKEFSHASSLYVHKRIHKGLKPYTCLICNMQFTQGGSLNRHMKKTHTEEKS